MGLTAWLLRTFGLPTLTGQQTQMKEAQQEAARAVKGMPVDTDSQRKARFGRFARVMQEEYERHTEED